MSHGGYLSPSKAVLLVAVEQYARHYDWGAAARAEVARLLVGQLCASAHSPHPWTAATEWSRVRRELDAIRVTGESGDEQTLRVAVGERLAAQLQTVDGLHEFFDGVARLVVVADAQPALDNESAVLLDSESVFGVFVRRCCLAFDQLEFHQVGRFFADCRRAADALLLEDNDDDSPTDASDNDSDNGTLRRSQLELQEHVEHLIAALEAEAAAPVGAAMEAQIRAAGEQLPDHSRLHYLRYLALVRTGESEQCEAALRRFFDSSHDGRAAHQCALLYLAAMRAQLGMGVAARQALDEATHVARDCQDHACLLFIACWDSQLRLARLRDAAPDPQCVRAAQSAIAALIEKAAAMQAHEIQAVGCLQLVDFLLATGAGPREVFEAVVRAQAVAVEHGAVQQQRGACRLAAAQAWQEHGCAWLAQLSAQLAARAPLAERERAQMRRALMCSEAALCAARPDQRQVEAAARGFVHPARADDLAVAAEWLAVRDECLGAPCREPGAEMWCSDPFAARLREARALAAGGYVCEARDALLAIADGPGSPPALAAEIAREMLARMPDPAASAGPLGRGALSGAIAGGRGR
ncbi:Anaphase-promoting complex subunit 5 [Coemansia javaensis]|uniref:Anaphase-promoting complex subunit 5 n=1 Tax=Coemansia javaensis TaxID=2761396 RepID=A0A9W8HIC4_9FUNG|nr:Anaphase-promoting complex subunit 5 [Coemansia javaensis]